MKNIIDLSNYQLESKGLFFNHRSTVKIGDDIYYLKDYDDPIELIVCEFCHLLDIPCVDYQIAKKDDKFYLISKSFRQKGCKYIKGGDLIDDFLIHSKKSDLRKLHMANFKNGTKNNLETIWLSLASKYSKDKSKYADIRSVMVSLLKQYFLMIMIQDADFHRYNWEIEESDNHISLSPKFDNASAFNDMEIWGVPMGVSVDDPFRTSVESLEYFLSITDIEDINLFLDLFYKATPEVLQEAINIVKEKYEIDDPFFYDKLMDCYINHRKEIYEVLITKGLIR